jgi:uncharacterized membrane protein
MKKITLLVLGFIIFTLSAGQVKAQEAFTISDFHSDITIREDSSFEVTETIVVEFSQDRHGIYRDLDTQTIRANIKNVLNENNEPWNYTIEPFDYGTRIKIGDADKLINGRQVYKITYEVTDGIGFFEDYDEIYWNVTGNFWNTYIQNASATIHLPGEIKKDDITTTCYTGSLGSEANDCTYTAKDNQAEFSVTGELNPYEGLTIVAGFPKGILTEPSSLNISSNVASGSIFVDESDKSVCEAYCSLTLAPGQHKILIKKWGYATPDAVNVELSPGESKDISFTMSAIRWWKIARLLIVLFFIFVAIEPIITYFRKGRDPHRTKTIIAEYGPPDKLPPVEVGSIVDERADMRDISATIIDLAVRGFLRIKEIPGGKLWIFKIPSEYELTRVTPKPGKPTELSEFEDQLIKDVFESKEKIKLSDLRFKFYKKLPNLKDIVYKNLVDKGYFPQSPDKTRNRYIIKGIIFFVLSFFLLFIETALFGTGFSFLFFINGILTIMFAKAMPQKTEKGVETHRKILGFKLYMNTAEKDRLKFQEKENLFYEFLPYAMALGIVKKWSKAFEGVLKNAPDWYEGGTGHFNAPIFVGNITSVSNQIQSSFASSPRSSGGGSGFSGGFSGGGGGGGGGGSW